MTILVAAFSKLASAPDIPGPTVSVVRPKCKDVAMLDASRLIASRGAFLYETTLTGDVINEPWTYFSTANCRELIAKGGKLYGATGGSIISIDENDGDNISVVSEFPAKTFAWDGATTMWASDFTTTVVIDLAQPAASNFTPLANAHTGITSLVYDGTTLYGCNATDKMFSMSLVDGAGSNFSAYPAVFMGLVSTGVLLASDGHTGTVSDNGVPTVVSLVAGRPLLV